MVIVQGIHKISDVLDKIMEYVIVAMLGVMVVVTGAQIVCRVFFTALSWSEELTRYLLIWSSLLGAGCVYKHSGHIAISALQELLPGRLKYILRILVHILCMIAFALIVFYGWKYFGKQGHQLSPTMRLPMRDVYLCIPLGAGIMFIHALDAVLHNLAVMAGKEEK